MPQHISSQDVLPWKRICNWQEKKSMTALDACFRGTHCLFFKEVLHYCFCETRPNIVINPKRILKSLFFFLRLFCFVRNIYFSLAGNHQFFC